MKPLARSDDGLMPVRREELRRAPVGQTAVTTPETDIRDPALARSGGWTYDPSRETWCARIGPSRWLEVPRRAG